MHKQKKLGMPLILLLTVVIALLAGPYLPETWIQIFYAISLTIKEILLFLLPLIIFSLLVGSIANMSGGALKMIFLLIPMVCLSNFISTWIAYGVGASLNQLTHIGQTVIESKVTLTPFWDLPIPHWISNDVALFSGLLTGLLLAYWNEDKAHVVGAKLSIFAGFLLKRCILPAIPLFIVGFLLKLQYESLLTIIVREFAVIFAVIFATQVTYIVLLYGLATGFKPRAWGQALLNMLPPVITGFSTLSSAATLPLTLIAAEKNTNDPKLSRFVVPSTVNIHLIGDAIAIPLFALAIMKAYGHGFPDPATYFTFAIYFVLAKFAVAAVPGGGVFVMLPVLKANLGFQSDMLSFITALYIMMDSVITMMNVSGNGAFVMLYQKILKHSQSIFSGMYLVGQKDRKIEE